MILEKDKREDLFQSMELENAVLGACILEKTAFGRIYGTTEAKHFHYSDNRFIFESLLELWTNNLPVDSLTLWLHIKSKNPAELVCGENIPFFITQKCRNVVSTAHLEYHSILLSDMWKRRQIENLTLNGFDPYDNSATQINEILRKATEINGNSVSQDWYTMDELMYLLIQHQDKITSGEQMFVKTGLNGLDNLNGGFSAGQLIVIGARPSVGKSAFAGGMAMDIAARGKKVGFISLEMNNTEIAARFASHSADVDFKKIFQNLFKDENEKQQFYNKINDSINLPIYVSDKTKVDVNEIKSKAQKLKHRHGVDLLVIDYLQLVEGTSKNKNYNREQEVASISRGLKLMALEMKIPVILLCQLNREVTARGKSGSSKYPVLSDLRESGAIEQDADVVLMLHRDWMADITEDENGQSTEHQADLIISKWRNGETGRIKLGFDGPKMRFKNVTHFSDSDSPF